MRRALLVALVLPLAAPAAGRAACEPRDGERVAKRSDAAVVLARASTYAACDPRTGARVALDHGRLGDVTIAGTWIAYSVRRNLRLLDASTARRFELGRLGRIGMEELVVGPDGSVAWIRIRMRRDDAVLTARDPGGRVRRLDRSADPLTLLGLSLEDRTVRWTNGDRRRAAVLKTRDPCLPRAGERVEADSGEVVIVEEERKLFTTPVLACLRASGARIAIAEEEATRDRTASTHSFAIAGRIVAFLITSSTGESPGFDTLVAHDLDRDRDHVLDDGPMHAITEIALTRGGHLTWRNDGRPRATRLR